MQYLTQVIIWNFHRKRVDVHVTQHGIGFSEMDIDAVNNWTVIKYSSSRRFKMKRKAYVVARDKLDSGNVMTGNSSDEFLNKLHLRPSVQRRWDLKN